MSTVRDKVVEFVDQSFKEGVDVLMTQSETDKDLWILSNTKMKRVCMIGEIENPFLKEEQLLVAYRVDVSKWIWAESEGFSKDDIVGKLRDTVFFPLSLDKVVPFLTKIESVS